MCLHSVNVITETLIKSLVIMTYCFHFFKCSICYLMTQKFILAMSSTDPQVIKMVGEFVIAIFSLGESI